MSTTPRTDAAEQGSVRTGFVNANLCREFELDLTSTREALRTLALAYDREIKALTDGSFRGDDYKEYRAAMVALTAESTQEGSK